jgi:hypothetical protein
MNSLADLDREEALVGRAESPWSGSGLRAEILKLAPVDAREELEPFPGEQRSRLVQEKWRRIFHFGVVRRASVRAHERPCGKASRRTSNVARDARVYRSTARLRGADTMVRRCRR